MLYFAFHLAKELGQPLQHVLAMSSEEFTYWMAFYKLNAKKTHEAHKAAQRKAKGKR